MLVAAAARAASCDDDARVGVREVGHEPALGVEHLRADRDRHDRVVPARAVRQTPAAAAAAAPAQLLIGPDAGQVAPARIGDEHDVAAGTAVTAVRTALRHVFLAAEMDRPVAAAAALHPQPGAIVEHDAL